MINKTNFKDTVPLMAVAQYYKNDGAEILDVHPEHFDLVVMDEDKVIRFVSIIASNNGFEDRKSKLRDDENAAIEWMFSNNNKKHGVFTFDDAAVRVLDSSHAAIRITTNIHAHTE